MRRVGWFRRFVDETWAYTEETARPFGSNLSAPSPVVGVFAAEACAIFGAGCTLAPTPC